MKAHPPPVTKRKPLVLIPACSRMLGYHPFFVAGRKYVEAIRLAECLPLVVPPVPQGEIDTLLDMADGILLTGSPSNVHPSHFGEEVHDTSLPLDLDRDGWTLPIIPRALSRGVPLFGICRGFQEANVALGGSLHQAVQEVPGQHDHRGVTDGPLDVQYGFAHDVEVVPGGRLQSILGLPGFRVNSVHGQGVKRLATGLQVEARAPDGLIEAFSMPGDHGFNLCVQWHPEWLADQNPVSTKLFKAFGAACRSYHERRVHPEPDR
jgi:putative glutamine amidotransferase